jgi:hypothetical protein
MVTPLRKKISRPNIEPFNLRLIKKAPKCPKKHLRIKPVIAEDQIGTFVVFSSSVTTLGISMMNLLY